LFVAPDPSGVEASYRRVHDRLWRSLFAFTGDADCASEAEAEALCQAIGRGTAIRDVDAWLWRAAFRIAGGVLAERRRTVELQEVLGPDGGGPPSTNDLPLVDFLDELSQLSEQQRAAVVLRHVGGFRPTEIAELLDSTPGSIRVQLHRAYAKLRSQQRSMP
jgi:DNA-directed RNA polymerase specialized sigma24 family protein